MKGKRIACWINTHLQYTILIAYRLQQWLHERASLLFFSGETSRSVDRITSIGTAVKHNFQYLYC